MAAVTAAAVGVAAVGASVYGASQQADAARGAGQAADRASQDWLNYSRGQSQSALNAYNDYVPAAQASIDKAMQAQTANLQRQQALVASIDPALIEAGKQTQDLLQGKSAPVLNNLQNQRQLQRQSMLDSLRQQLGPGAETSSIGQNMLVKFDSETANILSNAQQSYLNSVSGLALGGGQTLSQTLSGVNDTLAKLGGDYAQLGANKANIINGGTASMSPANQSVVQNAGGAFAGQAAQGALWQNIGKGAGQLGGFLGDFASGSSTSGGSTAGGGSSGLQMPTLGASSGFGQSANYGLGTLGSSVSSPVNRTGQGSYASTPGAVPSYLQVNSGPSGTGSYVPPNLGF